MKHARIPARERAEDFATNSALHHLEANTHAPRTIGITANITVPLTKRARTVAFLIPPVPQGKK